MDEELGPPTPSAADVPTETQPDGSVTEVSTGEQVADQAGNASWYNSNYPGQIQNDPASASADPSAATGTSTAALPTSVSQSVSNTGISVELPSGSLQFSDAAQYDAWSKNPSAFAVSNVGGVNTVFPYTKPTTNSAATPAQDAYNLTILNAEQTTSLTRNVNPALVNSLVDPNSPAAASSVLAANNSASAVDTGAGSALSNNSAQTAAAAQNLLAQNKPNDPNNLYLNYIVNANQEIAKSQTGIADAQQNILTNQQTITTAEGYIAQNNAELANPNISAARRAELEASNAQYTQDIFTANQNNTAQTTYISEQQQTIQTNQAAIATNAAGYRANTPLGNDPFAPPAVTTDTATTTTVANAIPTTSATAVDPATLEGFGVPASAASPIPTTNAPGGIDPATIEGYGVPASAASPIPTTNAPGAVDPTTIEGYGVPASAASPIAIDTGASPSAVATQVGRQLAQQQAVLAAQKKLANNGDWRVRLSLAPGAQYLYNVDATGILAPLAKTDGVVFPYTPRIETAYKADYESYALTHSNYKGYFYKGSYTDAVNISAIFTAQDTSEANYLLAVIHFFRSVTKMFYGQDPQRGAPPPLVYLTGLGQYQFAQHPCVVTSFNYSLPSDVDYIRARSTNINGANMLTRRNQQDLPTNPISGAVARLQNLFSGQGISYGAEICRPPPPTLGQNQPTYVPTKMEISISLLPVQTRNQVTNQFSLRSYANGDLLKGGFW